MKNKIKTRHEQQIQLSYINIPYGLDDKSSHSEMVSRGLDPVDNFGAEVSFNETNN